MKKKKWLYSVAAAAAAALVALLLNNRETASQIPAILISVIIGVVLMLAVVLLAIYYINRNRRREEAFRAAAVAVTGRVTKVEKMPVKQREAIYGTGQDLYILRAAYDYEGKRYTGAKRSYFGKPACNVGDLITIYVDPKEPGRCKILADRENTAKPTA